MDNNPIFNSISKKAIKSEYFLSLYHKAVKNSSILRLFGVNDDSLTSKEFKDLCRFSDIFSGSTEQVHRSLAYKVITLLYEEYNTDKLFIHLAKGVLEKIGLFHPSDKLLSNIKLPFERHMSAGINRYLYKNPLNSDIFTQRQFELYCKLTSGKSSSFSAPTSMGKSYLIKTYIISSIIKMDLVCVIVPTKALVEQYSADLRELLSNSQIISDSVSVSTHSSNYTKSAKTIFVLTPERLNSLLYQNIDFKLDMLFVDEAHKLTEDDERSITLYKVIGESIRRNSNTKVHFASPLVKNPEIFLNSFGLDDSLSTRITESPVAQNLMLIDFHHNNASHYVEPEDKLEITSDLNSFDNFNDFLSKISKNSESNIIFCSNPNIAVNRSVEFVSQFKTSNSENINRQRHLNKYSNQLKQFIHDDYFLSDLIMDEVAFHHGKLPSFVRRIIESLYQQGHIKYIFCTSTLLEGVNLPTQNMFILNTGMISSKRRKKSNRGIATNKETLCFWNLSGRAGRYAQELQGNIYCIKEKEDEWENICEVVSRKEAVDVKPTVSSKVEKNLRAILNRIINDKVADDKSERMVEQIANILLSDALRHSKGEEKGILLDSLLEEKYGERLSAALRDKITSLDLDNISLEVFSSNHSISNILQSEVIKNIKSDNYIRLTKVDFIPIEEFLLEINIIYKLKFNAKQIKRLCVLIHKWINGASIREIISSSISRKEKGAEITVTNKSGEDSREEFDPKNKHHINTIIHEVLFSLEDEIGFKLEKYITHYYQSLCSVLGENEAGINLSIFIEYGTRNTKEMVLQSIGFSRLVANSIVKECDSIIKINETTFELVEFPVSKIKSYFDIVSIEHDELLSIKI